MFMPNYSAEMFVDWLNEQMKNNNWSVRETARRAGISHTPLSFILNGNQPSFETCVALAKAFRVPEEQVLRLAGLLPAIPKDEAEILELNHIYQNASAEKRADLLRYARYIDDEYRAPQPVQPISRPRPSEGSA